MELTVEEISILKFVAKKNKPEYDKYIKISNYKVKTKIKFKQDYEDSELFLVKKGSKGIIKEFFEDKGAETAFCCIELIDLKIDVDGFYTNKQGLHEGNEFDNSVCLDLNEVSEYLEICTDIEKSTSFKKVKIGDTIKITEIYNFEVVRDNDINKYEVRNIFISSGDICNVVGKDQAYILIACYNGSRYPNENYYVIKLYSGKFNIIGSHKNNYRGAIYYKEDFFGYVNEDDDYVYLAHYYIYQKGKDAMRKVKKDEYYKCAIGINDFDYAKSNYKPEWGLIGTELA